MPLSWMMLRKQGAITKVETWLLFAPLSKFLATCLNGANDKLEVCVLSNIYVLQYNSSNSSIRLIRYFFVAPGRISIFCAFLFV